MDAASEDAFGRQSVTVTWVILTIPLWEKPHRDEGFSERDLLGSIPNHLVCNLLEGLVETYQRHELRREACRSNQRGSGGRGAEIIPIESQNDSQARRPGVLPRSRHICWLCLR